MAVDEELSGELQALREELDHFIRLSQVQAKQLKRYQNLQRRSHQMILKLINQIKELKSIESASFRK